MEYFQWGHVCSVRHVEKDSFRRCLHLNPPMPDEFMCENGSFLMKETCQQSPSHIIHIYIQKLFF